MIRLAKNGARITEAKTASAMANIRLATIASKEAQDRRFSLMEPWQCAYCKVEKKPTVHQRRMVYCSKSCMSIAYRKRMVGSANPNFKNIQLICENCGDSFHAFDKKRKYCSQTCYFTSERYTQMPRGLRKDDNHNFIEGLLRAQGFETVDISKLGNGAPDLLVCKNRVIQIVEIKNPNTSYGRRNGNPRQKEWAKEWDGVPIYILRTEKDVNNFARGRYSELSCVG